MQDVEVVIIGGVRTPMADYVGVPGGGKFKDISAIQLGAIATKAALEKFQVPMELIDEVIFGYGMQSSPDGGYGARHVSLFAGLPETVPALTVGRTCGSGFQSIITGAKDILLGESDFVVAGGMENMSQVPYVLRGAREGFRMGDQKVEDYLMNSLYDSYCKMNMAQTADKLANMYGVTREDADQFAYESQMKAAAATKEGRFKEEIVAVDVKHRREIFTVDSDDHIRPDTTPQTLAKIPPAFGKDSIVTGGNASGIVDGAAAVIIGGREKAKEHGFEPIGKIVAWAIVGVDPSIMGIGAAESTKRVLKKAGLKLEQIDLFEVNEAFACQCVAVEKELGLDRDRVNVNGGAIALGHPLGMSGTRLTYTLLLELRSRNLKYGLATACTGGGQGVAVIMEAFAN
ncbi:MAG: thiolase family protein [Deltaproteobacteria bacterium]|nr:thiolase family protein [Deltaproteobacteria bacterium]